MWCGAATHYGQLFNFKLQSQCADCFCIRGPWDLTVWKVSALHDYIWPVAANIYIYMYVFLQESVYIYTYVYIYIHTYIHFLANRPTVPADDLLLSAICCMWRHISFHWGGVVQLSKVHSLLDKSVWRSRISSICVVVTKELILSAVA